MKKEADRVINHTIKIKKPIASPLTRQPAMMAKILHAGDFSDYYFAAQPHGGLI